MHGGYTSSDVLANLNRLSATGINLAGGTIVFDLETITPSLKHNTKMVGIYAETFTIGRHGDYTTPPQHNSVSRIHCAIMRNNLGIDADGTVGGYTIKDMNSFVGTRVNMEGIGNQSRQLKDGDIIQLGNTVEVQFTIQGVKLLEY